MSSASPAALVFEGRHHTLPQLEALADGLAAGLRERGVTAGERVAVMASNRPEFVATIEGADLYDMPTEIDVAADGPLRIITLNRPDSLNSVNDALHHGLAKLWQRMSDDQSVRAAVIRCRTGVFGWWRLRLPQRTGR